MARSRSRREFLAISLAACGACTNNGGRHDIAAWGEQGLRDGAFLRPRAIGVRDGEVFVIDTTGRVQVFSESGAFFRAWSTPNAKNGTPTGIEFGDDRRVLVPDTHYSQMLEYTADGELARQWGAYGSGPDQFIYPTDVTRTADGALYVSEYGEGAERIHVFESDGTFRAQWGTFGEGPGEFNRAMAIDSDDQGHFFVADTGNHRVQVFDQTGAFQRIIGGPDTGEGALKFPYDLTLAPDGTLLVADYGANAILRYSDDGVYMAKFGAPGRGLGEFNAPRGVAISSDNVVFVADTDNHRIQSFPLDIFA